MAFENPTRDEIREILQQAGNIAVVGLSDKPDRTSYMIAEAMQNRGYRIIPVNPNAAGRQILGETCYASLKDIPEPQTSSTCFAEANIARTLLGKRPRFMRTCYGCSSASSAMRRRLSPIGAA